MKKFLPQNKSVFWIYLSLLSIFILSIFSYAMVFYVFNPSNIKTPAPEHLHYRMQLIVEGNYINFGEQKFQEAYTKGSCSFDITETPIHFHDGEDQVVHVHWKKMTGGQVLKYYGINLLDYFDNTMGYRMDKSLLPSRVPVQGRNFANIEERINKKELNIFVYTGEKDNFSSKDSKDFLNKDLESFFGVNSLISKNKVDLFSIFKPLKADAHGGDKNTLKENNEINFNKQLQSASSDKNDTPSEEELKKINNLIGNVVIFIQKDEPALEQVKERFDNLTPLKNSVCGG